jgi:hypothetical protein
MANPVDIIEVAESSTVTADGVPLTASQSTALANLAAQAANTLTGNNTGSPAAAGGLTVAQVKTLLAYVPADILSGSGIVWDATNLSLLLGGAATSVQSSLAILASKTVAVPAANTAWQGINFQASTLTLTAGGVAPSSLNAVYFATPTVTSAATYTVTDASTLTIAGPPTVGGSVTITKPWALCVQSGKSLFGTSTAESLGAYTVPVTMTGIYTFIHIRGTTNCGIVYNYNGTSGFLTCLNQSQHFRLSPLIGASETAVSTSKDGVLGLTIMNTSGNVGINNITDAAATSLNVVTSKTIASGTGAVWDGVKFSSSTVSITGATAITTATGLNLFTLQAPTIVGNTATCAISLAATLYISGAPIASTNVTIAKPYSLWIDGGLPRIDSTTANGTVAVVLTSLGPTGANTTVQEWLTVDINGTTRYLPAF